MRPLIAIPVYNEQRYLQRVLDRVRLYHEDILVVDDGSTDGTPGILSGRRDIQVIGHGSNQGYGQSLIDAFRYADDNEYDWIITMDCDEQHEPERIPQFIEVIGGERWDIISGSRYLRPSQDDDLPPSDRRSVNVTITAILNDLFGWSLTDAFCGFKAHRVSAMRRLELNVAGYAFPMQFWPQAAAGKLRISEIPVRLIYKDPTRHFGGALDDVEVRLTHYLNVLTTELAKIQQRRGEAAGRVLCSCSCTD